MLVDASPQTWFPETDLDPTKSQTQESKYIMGGAPEIHFRNVFRLPPERGGREDIPSLQCTADNADISNSLAQRSFGSEQQDALHVVPSAPTYKRVGHTATETPLFSRAERGGCQKSHGLDTLHLGNSCGVHQQSSPMSLRAPVH